jgi:hypothetical protein
VAPFLIYGFLVATCQNAQGQTLGFLVIDKQQLSPIAAQGYIMIAMAGGAIAGLLAHWGLIRTFHMTPKDLLRWGVVLAAGGNLVVALAPDYTTVVVGFALSSLGYGFARPGFTAGASLAVDLGEQARAAGASPPSRRQCPPRPGLRLVLRAVGAGAVPAQHGDPPGPACLRRPPAEKRQRPRGAGRGDDGLGAGTWG